MAREQSNTTIRFLVSTLVLPVFQGLQTYKLNWVLHIFRSEQVLVIVNIPNIVTLVHKMVAF